MTVAFFAFSRLVSSEYTSYYGTEQNSPVSREFGCEQQVLQLLGKMLFAKEYEKTRLQLVVTLLFHLAIAKASGNSTMNTFMLIITPEIITNFEKYHVCDKGLAQRGIIEHEEIFDAIKRQKPQLAKAKMKEHFSVLYQYCYNV